jgi:hypothetical protein
LKVTFLGRPPPNFCFRGKSIIVDFKKEGVLKKITLFKTKVKGGAGGGATSVPTDT